MPLVVPRRGAREVRYLVKRLRRGAAVAISPGFTSPGPGFGEGGGDLDSMGMLVEGAPGRAEVFCTGSELYVRDSDRQSDSRCGRERFCRRHDRRHCNP